MALGDIFRLSIEGFGPQNQQLVNVFHYRQEGTIGNTNGIELIDGWIQDVQPEYLACISDQCAITKMEVRRTDNPAIGVDYSPDPIATGLLTGDAMSPNNPAIITWRTFLFGRSYRGRTYMWPGDEVGVEAGQVNTTYSDLLDIFATAAQNITESVTGAVYQLQVWSPTLNSAEPVQSWQVQPFLGVQRRRRSGTGA